MGQTAKKTLLAALLAWLLTRVLRRLLAVALLAALLAGGLAVTERHGADVGRAGRVVRCELHAIAGAAKQLRDGATSSSPAGLERRRRALRPLARCQRPSGPATDRRQRAQR